MSVTAIDINVLDDLFDNQKKLDNMFDTMFDDDLFQEDATVLTETPVSTNLTYNDINTAKSNKFISLFLPVIIEVVAIYYLVAYFA